MIVFQPDLITVLTFVVGIVLPLLVGLVTTRTTSPARKAILLAALALVTSVLSGVLEAVTNGTEYDLFANFFVFLGVFVTSVAMYFGVWSRAGSSGESVSSILQDTGRTPKHRTLDS